MVAEYVWVLQEKLGVRDWDVRLKMEPPEDPDALGQVAPVYGRKVTPLRLAPDLFSFKAEEVRNTLVHELLHLILTPVSEVIRTDLNALGGLTQREYDGLWHYYAREVEYAVDHLAQVIAPLMPELPWETGEGSAASRYVDLEEHVIHGGEDPVEHTPRRPPK